ncbi:hypothetical protein C2845_PM08G01200 [Panicum miliaceum]|uniref:NAC domain-containing protein n=1 Tax=Panicum miliaceum TaxID=4540 RepID=A0A3L6R2U7_PANMI|nr:hypothetical protein C2845_PM08G01200 [Panicum miliaceum]
MAADGSLTRHGFPRGYRFVPTQLELIYLLSDRIHRGKLPPGFDRIFHNLRILDYHPEELYGQSDPCNLPGHLSSDHPFLLRPLS